MQGPLPPEVQRYTRRLTLLWVVYFAVTDCDAAASQVLELGGDLFMQPMEMGPGKFAGATDPTGAMFFFGSFPDLA